MKDEEMAEEYATAMWRCDMTDEEKKNCTDCRHFGNCWLRRHKDNDEPCEDFELEEWEKEK